MKISLYAGDSGVNCLQVVDGDNADTNTYDKLETGVALRKRLNYLKNDTLTWTAPAGSTLIIYFPNGSPFAGPPTIVGKPVAGTIQAASGALTGTFGRFKYTITLITPVAGALTTFIEDPQIIVDNGPPIEVHRNRSKSKTAKRK